MKKWVSGLVVGMILASATVVGASSSNLQVQDASHVKFTFNGQGKALPSDYKVLMYQDHTYVPARLVAENMGATVNWDDANQTVIIKTNNVKNISAYTKDVNTALISQNVPVKSVYFSADENGGFMSFNYNDTGVSFDQLGLYITQMSVTSVMYSEPLDGAMIHVFDSQGINRIASYWVPSEKTIQFGNGQISKADYINSWVVTSYR